jgi:hypothetical protein
VALPAVGIGGQPDAAAFLALGNHCTRLGAHSAILRKRKRPVSMST